MENTADKELKEEAQKVAEDFLKILQNAGLIGEISDVGECEFISEESAEECKPLPNFVYPPNCGKRKRHSKRRGRQYGRKC